ncbi:hypothetical protein [Streptomyces sp. NBC_01264]|uniref:hypothetical protein n=1 Tax=Streptomyces sp. NBC_01264 TaxID=2903804 RepID=UPI00224CF955|nr:hypothetical protein [Streptomyces sp. NBC_01264]MCX4781731.1 hypothetical protein [Streptomyces sp. NBC_01264]
MELNPTDPTQIAFQGFSAVRGAVPKTEHHTLYKKVVPDLFGTALKLDRKKKNPASRLIKVRFTYVKMHSTIMTVNSVYMAARAAKISAWKVKLQNLKKKLGPHHFAVVELQNKIEEYSTKVRFRIPVEVQFDLTQIDRHSAVDYDKYLAEIEAIAAVKAKRRMQELEEESDSDESFGRIDLPAYDGDSIKPYLGIGAVDVHECGGKIVNSNSEKLDLAVAVICNEGHTDDREGRYIKLIVTAFSSGCLLFDDKVQEVYEIAFLATADGKAKRIPVADLLPDQKPYHIREAHENDKRVDAHFPDIRLSDTGKMTVDDILDAFQGEEGTEVSEQEARSLVDMIINVKGSDYTIPLDGFSALFKRVNPESGSLFDFSLGVVQRVYHLGIPKFVGESHDFTVMCEWVKSQRGGFLLDKVITCILDGKDDEAYRQLKIINSDVKHNRHATMVEYLLVNLPARGYKVVMPTSGRKKMDSREVLRDIFEQVRLSRLTKPDSGVIVDNEFATDQDRLVAQRELLEAVVYAWVDGGRQTDPVNKLLELYQISVRSRDLYDTLFGLLTSLGIPTGNRVEKWAREDYASLLDRAAQHVLQG